MDMKGKREGEGDDAGCWVKMRVKMRGGGKSCQVKVTSDGDGGGEMVRVTGGER